MVLMIRGGRQAAHLPKSTMDVQKYSAILRQLYY
jgi:hypothetical protein